MSESRMKSRKFWVSLIALTFIGLGMIGLYIAPDDMLKEEYTIFAEAIKPILKSLVWVVGICMGLIGGKDLIKQSQVQDQLFEESENEKD